MGISISSRKSNPHSQDIKEAPSNENPVNKIVFIAKILPYASRSPEEIIRHSGVTSSWNETTHNYSVSWEGLKKYQPKISKNPFEQSSGGCVIDMHRGERPDLLSPDQ